MVPAYYRRQRHARHRRRNNTNNVFKAPLGGGAAVPMASASGYKLVAQDATYLYLLQTGCCQSTLLKVIK